jgi:hypothetical protein
MSIAAEKMGAATIESFTDVKCGYWCGTLCLASRPEEPRKVCLTWDQKLCEENWSEMAIMWKTVLCL